MPRAVRSSSFEMRVYLDPLHKEGHPRHFGWNVMPDDLVLRGSATAATPLSLARIWFVRQAMVTLSSIGNVCALLDVAGTWGLPDAPASGGMVELSGESVKSRAFL